MMLSGRMKASITVTDDVLGHAAFTARLRKSLYRRCPAARLFTAATSSAGSTGLLMCV